MSTERVDDINAQYGTTEPLLVRVETHRLYEERAVNLDEEAARILSMTPADSLLDAGCGPGEFLRYLRQIGHTGTLAGLDLSPGMVEAARAAAQSATCLVGSASELPFVDRQFDWCVARHMLYHVPDISRALRELIRVASSGVLLSTGSRASLPHLEGLLGAVLDEHGFTSQAPVMARFCIENAGSVLEEAGVTYREYLIDNALVFHEPEPMAAYVLSCLPSYGITPGDGVYRSMAGRVYQLAADTLRHSGGEVRDPKVVGFYLLVPR